MRCLICKSSGKLANVRHLQVLMLDIIELIRSRDDTLSAWELTVMDSRAVYAQSTQRRFSRRFTTGRDSEAYQAYAL